ncbi:MAG TPA: tetratricopeptide repeat protein [Chthoniobacterales bacterium]|nr:tetratricopeptide repeat protein [Chthoniobacterales bacterium]
MAAKKRRGKSGKRGGSSPGAGNPRASQPGPTLDRAGLWIAVALVVSTFAVYGQVLTHRFINFDDDTYIWANPMVAAGLTWKGFAWAFTAFHSFNWHPLTWLSHMIDSQLFGLHAGGHLLVNTALHALNAVLLFFFLNRATGATWQSAIIAALFALHPLHAESVAWASERKDVLSTAFGLLCLLAYGRYAAAPSWKRYAAVALWLALGLMAKPMLVTWPFVLLLLDWWPFNRIAGPPANSGGRSARGVVWPLIREKLPLFFLVIPSMFLTYLAQAQGGATRSLSVEPLSWRLANALVSYAKYLGLTFWPRDLSVFYPALLGTIPIWQWIGALVLLAAISFLVVRNARARPYLLVGWFWFVGTLVPVIGLVRVGNQALADRYTYIPSIGLFIAIVFGLAELVAASRLRRLVAICASIVAIAVLGGLSAVQVSRWRDSETLFGYVISINPANAVAQNNLGTALGARGKHAEALPYFAEAVRLEPRFFDALVNMGQALRHQGEPAQAVGYFERALALSPKSAKTHWQLGLALETMGNNEEAMRQFHEAVRLAPKDSNMRINLGTKLAQQSRFAEAAEHYEQAVRLDPNSAEAHNYLGLVLFPLGRPAEALREFSTALRLKPDFAMARDNVRRVEESLRK